MRADRRPGKGAAATRARSCPAAGMTMIAAGHKPKPTCGTPQGPCSAGSSGDRSSAGSSTSTIQRLEAADQRPWPNSGPACPRPVRGRRRAARPRPPACRRAITARASRRSLAVCARADAPPRVPQGGAPSLNPGRPPQNRYDQTPSGLRAHRSITPADSGVSCCRQACPSRCSSSCRGTCVVAGGRPRRLSSPCR